MKTTIRETIALSAIQTRLPAGFYAENRRGYLAIFYPGNVGPLSALKIMREAGAQGYNDSVSGPCHEFPRHLLA